MCSEGVVSVTICVIVIVYDITVDTDNIVRLNGRHSLRWICYLKSCLPVKRRLLTPFKSLMLNFNSGPPPPLLLS